QTITNIIADQMAQGRSVLFVAAKGAALDVVRHRLDEVGLGRFVLDLHDRNARPTEVRATLAAALQQRPVVDDDGYRVDAGQVSATSQSLASYAHGLHDTNPAQLSLYSARNRLLAQGEGPSCTVTPAELNALDPAKLTELRRGVGDAVPQLARVLGASRSTVPAWSFARSFPVDGDLPARLRAADPAVEQAVSDLGRPEQSAAVRRCATLADLAGTRRLLTAPWSPDQLDQTQQERWVHAHRVMQERTERLREQAASLLASFLPSVVEVEVTAVRQAVRVAAESFFIGRKGRLLTAAAPVLAHLRPGAELRPKDLPETVERLATLVQDHDAVRTGWRDLPGLWELPDRINLLDEQAHQSLTRTVDQLVADRDLMAALPAETVAAVRRARQFDGRLDEQIGERLDRARDALAAVFAQVASSERDIARFGRDGLLDTWQATAAERSADAPHWVGLRRWTDLQETLSPLTSTLPTAADELLSGVIDPIEAAAAVERGLASSSLQERWSATGLTGFDGESHDRTVTRFADASTRLRDDLRQVLPAAVVQRRPFRAGAAVGRVGALEREVGRTRGGLSVRRLMATYGEVIQEVTPCVLVSPDSLARFVPYDTMTFDLVVFDEASQIRVPEAIGALARAKSVVVAGDSKQMPPTSMFATELDEVDDEGSEFAAIPDEESVLSECVHAGVPRLWLSWHYRSRDESLITFSNRAYYDGRLASFPTSPGAALDQGLEHVRVDGTFVRARSGRTAVPDDGVVPAGLPASSRAVLSEQSLLRTNPVEAAAVVAEVLRRWQRRERSIGVVTFNIQQRSLIERMLWESGVPGVQESLDQRSDELFVKNLETVQGDERDVVIFSTAFSATMPVCCR
ncbi:MAG TPA: DNA helicase, partial [Candidatus Avipropionibacterium avicola]|nr:DNA helicase [Candidatus Avipropionibacterium avicola]